MIPANRRLELTFWAMLPGIITVALAIISLVSKHLAGFNQFMPLLYVMPIFYWGMTHAREMPYWFVFLLGLVLDAVTGMPLGLSSLLYVLFLGMIHAQRKYVHKEAFVIKWGYFAALLGLIALLNWIILSLFNSSAQRVVPALVQWLITVGCYPFMHKSFDSIYEYIHSRRWQILHGS